MKFSSIECEEFEEFKSSVDRVHIEIWRIAERYLGYLYIIFYFTKQKIIGLEENKDYIFRYDKYL